jgi:chromosome transmission fidelity protein 1
MDETLRLETPSEFTSFPYTPYSIQLDLMKSLYAAIEGRKVAIMESPTGTVRLHFHLTGDHEDDT